MPNDIEIQGIDFEIKGTLDKGASSLDRFVESLRKIKQSAPTRDLKALSKGFSDIGKSIGKLSNGSTEELHNMIRELRAMPRAILGISTEMERLNKVDLSSMFRQTSDGMRMLTETANGLDTSKFLEFAHAVKKLVIPESGITYRPINAPPGTEVPIEKEIDPEAAKEAEAFFRALEKIWNALGKIAHALAAVGKKLASLLWTATKTAGKLSAKIFTAPIKSVAEQAKSAIVPVQKFLNSVGRIALYRAIRTMVKDITQAIREGINNLYQYSTLIGTEFHRSMNTLATDALYLKNSLGAVAGPIINMVAPAIDALTDRIATMLDLLAQLMAKLSGRDVYSRAIKHTTEFAKATSGAAKELKKFLAPFDELNVMPSNSGSGSGDAEDYLKMFEEATVGDKIEELVGDFPERLKRAFLSGNWDGLGQIVGDKINHVFSVIPWSEGGAKIGQAIQGVIATAYSFLKTTDFRAIGGNISESLNAALEQIDFHKAGGILSRKTTALLDLALGAIKKLNWKLIGKSVGDFLRGSFDEASDWLESVDWAQTGADLYQFLKDAIEGIDFATLAESFFKLLGEAIAAAVALVASFVQGVVKDVADYFHDYIYDEDGFKKSGKELWNGVLQGIGDAVTNIVGWLKEHVFDPFINGFKKVFEIHSPSKVMEEQGGFIVEGLKNGIVNRWNNLMDTLRQKWENLKNWWKNLTLPEFKIKMPHITWSTTPVKGVIGDILGAIGLPTELPKMNVSWYAQGGFPKDGELFVARESGAELVGRMGNRNTVANNDQIVSGITAGVREGNEDLIPLIDRVADRIVDAINRKQTSVTIDSRDIKRGLARNNLVTGGIA